MTISFWNSNLRFYTFKSLFYVILFTWSFDNCVRMKNYTITLDLTEELRLSRGRIDSTLRQKVRALSPNPTLYVGSRRFWPFSSICQGFLESFNKIFKLWKKFKRKKRRRKQPRKKMKLQRKSCPSPQLRPRNPRHQNKNVSLSSSSSFLKILLKIFGKKNSNSSYNFLF